MQKFTGMWKLDKYESFDSASGIWQNMESRNGYTGYIIYDGMGHVGVQLIPPGLKNFDSNKNIDSLNKKELKQTLQLYLSSFDYFGNCKVIPNQNLIEHHKLSSNHPEELGTTISRHFEFKSDTLILTASELINGHKTRLRWVKL